MKMALSQQILLIFALFKLTNQVYVVLEPLEQRCVSKDMVAKSSFSGVYYVSGEQEESNKVYITNPKGKILWVLKDHKNGSFNVAAEEEGKKFCIFRYILPML
jgi:hypothetical protein